VLGGTADVGDFLCRATLAATVHDESALVLRYGVGGRLVADDGHVCRHVVCGRAALRTIGAKTDCIAGCRFPCRRYLAAVDGPPKYDGLITGMVVLGIGVGLFYSSITTAAVTAFDPSRSSLAGGIIYMFQLAGGSIGLGLNTALVVTAGRS
jgi:hypothetical protein